MKGLLYVGVVLLFVSVPLARAEQIIAGSAEDKLYQRIIAEKDTDKKIGGIQQFEQEFPQSKILPYFYSMALDLYRGKGDRAKIIEYGEKYLKSDPTNVMTMMILSRNYSIQGANLDRALELAKQAVDSVAKMKTAAAPPKISESEWKDYVQRTEVAAQSILDYAKALRN